MYGWLRMMDQQLAESSAASRDAEPVGAPRPGICRGCAAASLGIALCSGAGGWNVTGLGAVAFRGLIGFVHDLLVLRYWSFDYDSSLFTPPHSTIPVGAAGHTSAVLGSIGVAFIVNRFAPEAKGHGVPEVMDAIYYQRGVIRPSSPWQSRLPHGPLPRVRLGSVCPSNPRSLPHEGAGYRLHTGNMTSSLDVSVRTNGGSPVEEGTTQEVVGRTW